VDQQPSVGLGAQQRFEDAVDLRVDGVFHGRSVSRIRTEGEAQGPRRKA
jgi:hypothetical protein